MRYFIIPFGLIGLVFFGMMACQEPATKTAEGDSSEAIQQKQFHASHYPKKKEAPFSDVVELGNTYYLSGQIGMDHTTRTLVSGGVEAETHQTLKNIEEVLERHDLAMSDVVKVMVVLKDMKDFSTFNDIYVTYFPQRPARTTFAAKELAANASVEIEVVAVRDN
tara:strand:+ start:11036 stop:11530 length:495 start_codon:yes stop_codon:yes gene_type:complete